MKIMKAVVKKERKIMNITKTVCKEMYVAT